MIRKSYPYWVVAGLVLANCATLSRDWQRAVDLNTTESYQEFLRKHPRSQFSDSADKRLENKAWSQAQEVNTSQSYQVFLHAYPHGKSASKASQRIAVIAWRRARELGTIDAFQSFLKDYPQSDSASEAKRRIERFAWDDVLRRDSREAYEDYLEKHPAGDFAIEAQNKLGRMAWEETQKLNSAEAYQQFAESYPESELAVEAKRRTVRIAYEKAQRTNTVESYEDFLASNPVGDLDSNARKYSQKAEDALIDRILHQGPGRDRFRIRDIAAKDQGSYSARMTIVGERRATRFGEALRTNPIKLYPKDQVVFALNTIDGYGMLPPGNGSVWCFVGTVNMAGYLSDHGYVFEGDRSDPVTFLLTDRWGLVYLHGKGRVVHDDSETKLGY